MTARLIAFFVFASSFYTGVANATFCQDQLTRYNMMHEQANQQTQSIGRYFDSNDQCTPEWRAAILSAIRIVKSMPPSQCDDGTNHYNDQYNFPDFELKQMSRKAEDCDDRDRDAALYRQQEEELRKDKQKIREDEARACFN